MCLAIEEIKLEGKMEGIQEGILKGKQEGKLEGIQEGIVRILKALMASQGITVEQAMDMTAIPPEDRARYAELVTR